MKTLIITRHKAFVALVKERHQDLLIDADVEVIDHVHDPSILDGATVIGDLSLQLASRCGTVFDIPMKLTPEDRAAGDLPLERLREIAGEPQCYIVRHAEDVDTPAEIGLDLYGKVLLCEIEKGLTRSGAPRKAFERLTELLTQRMKDKV